MRKAIPCECGCGRMIEPVRVNPRAWSVKKYFSPECRYRGMAEKGRINALKPKKRRKSYNAVHVAPNEKDRKWIHPILDEFLRRPA